MGDREGTTPNRSGDPIVDACQRMYGLQGEPWCAMGAGYVIANSPASSAFKDKARQIMHPYTGTIFDRAKERGWVTAGGASTPTGALFIIRGRHVGMVWRSYADGTFLTWEANSGDAVRSNRRAWSDGWQAIVIPGTGNAQAQGTVAGYGFDDRRVVLKGGWQTPHARDLQQRAWAKAHPDWWTQAVRVRKPSPYAFRTGPKGTWDRWSFGPWLGPDGKRIRDEQLARWQAANDGAPARTWRRDDYPGAGKAPGKED